MSKISASRTVGSFAARTIQPRVRSIATLPLPLPLASGPSSRPLVRPTASAGRSAKRASKRTFFSLPDITKLANLVPGAQSRLGEIVSGIQTDGEEQRFHARKILPYSQAQLYSLVSDVPSYSSFIPFCNASTVLTKPVSSASEPELKPEHSSSPSSDAAGSGARSREWNDWAPGREPFEVLAELSVGFGGLEERYVSKVVGRPFDSVTATASNQTPLFKSLITRWSFAPASTLSPHPTSSLASTPTSTSSTSTPTPIREPNSTAEADPNTGPTLLTIDLAFNFANPLHRIASQAVLPKVADKMVEAFEKRCLEVYGPGKV